jgi:hypothetical protein
VTGGAVAARRRNDAVRPPVVITFATRHDVADNDYGHRMTRTLLWPSVALRVEQRLLRAHRLPECLIIPPSTKKVLPVT